MDSKYSEIKSDISGEKDTVSDREKLYRDVGKEKAGLEGEGEVSDASEPFDNTAVDKKSEGDELVTEELAGGDEFSEQRAERTAEEDKPFDGNCSQPSFQWRGRCATPAEFCTAKFSTTELLHVKKPYSVVFDQNGKPLFCETKPGSYYLPGLGYRFCDRDGDGWLNIEAYRAVTSSDKEVKSNARCKLRKIDAIIYHPDTVKGTPEIQYLKSSVPLIETSRNDGSGKLIELPIYSDYNSPLPKGQSTACFQDSDCNRASGEVCYRGYCLSGRRFRPSELNTFTKACIKNIDLNHNLLDDPTETASDNPQPPEFAPLLKLAYFIELNYGFYQDRYNIGGKAIPVYHIFERPRTEIAKRHGLALLCGEDLKGKKPDYWRYCVLKDDQQCKAAGGKLKRGLSLCWLDKVKHATRSLFKCAVFDGQKDPKTYFFHPNNFGFQKKYTRSVCRLKASIIGKTKDKDDVEFECKVDTSPPNLTKNEVGWACVSFHTYQSPSNYLAGCIDECAESKKLPGAQQPCGANEVCKVESGSYGRGLFRCDTGGSGACRYSQNYCFMGKWTKCPKRTTPSPEVCDGLDNDCDGYIDEDPKNNNKQLSRHCYNGKSGCTKKPDGSYRCISPCKSGIQTCFTGNWEKKCWGESTPKPEVCNGKDDDCDGKVDENWSNLHRYCYDGWLGCRDRGKWVCRKDGRGVYCTAKRKNKPEVCNGKDDNCDGMTDEICPKTVDLSAIDVNTSSSPSYITVGKISPYSTPAPDCPKAECPQGSAITGIIVTVGKSSWLRMIGYVCSKPVALYNGVQNGNISYKLVFHRVKTYRCKAQNLKSSQEKGIYCPNGYVVTAISGKKGSYINQLTIWCSKAEIKKSGKSDYELSITYATKSVTVGKSIGSPFSRRGCLTSRAFTGMEFFFNNSNYSEISGLKAKCSELKVAYKEIANPTGFVCSNTHCPTGYIMTGIRIRRAPNKVTSGIFSKNPIETWIRKLEPICSKLKVEENRKKKPYTYSISFQTKLAGSCQSHYCCNYTYMGQNFAYPTEEVKCPSGYVLVGLSGKYSSYLDHLYIWCSKAELKSIGGRNQIVLGAAKNYGGVGKLHGGIYKYDIKCPKHMAISGFWTSFNKADHEEITGLTTFCSKLTVVNK